MSFSDEATPEEVAPEPEQDADETWSEADSAAVEAAVEEAVPADVITSALFARFRSRQDHTFADKMLSAMRQKFGGHIELKSPK